MTLTFRLAHTTSYLKCGNLYRPSLSQNIILGHTCQMTKFRKAALENICCDRLRPREHENSKQAPNVRLESEKGLTLPNVTNTKNTSVDPKYRCRLPSTEHRAPGTRHRVRRARDTGHLTPGTKTKGIGHWAASTLTY